MTPGKKYTFRFKLPGERKERFATAVFLETTEREHIFSGRPEFGTMRLPKDCISGPIEVAASSKCEVI